MTAGSLNIPGTNLAFVGIGGGSDCIQAAILALMSGKPACAISIRTSRTASQGATGRMGEERTVLNHGGEVAPGVFRITPETTGSGRFLEFIPAGKLPVYLVVDSQDGRLTEQIQAAVKDFGGADTVIAVDTGGDSLYRTRAANASEAAPGQDKATPDQDIASLKAICLMQGQSCLSCVVAKGVDSPPYADEILSRAQARAVFFSQTEQQRILDLYREFELDGSNPDRYGKTPFAWQAALRGETGRVRIPLPDKVVNDPVNPWNPYINIVPEMAGCHVMLAQNHLNAICRDDNALSTGTKPQDPKPGLKLKP